MRFGLAQVNVARLLAPIDSPGLAGFVAALDEVNAEADAAEGFVWRLQSAEGNATGIRAFEWDVAGSAGMIVNLSVWRDVDSLASYVYSGRHLDVMRRRRKWFVPMTDAYTALWWVPSGIRSTVSDAKDRIRRLREHGPTAQPFTLRRHWPNPDSGSDLRSAADGTDRLCPA